MIFFDKKIAKITQIKYSLHTIQNDYITVHIMFEAILMIYVENFLYKKVIRHQIRHIVL